VLTDAEATRTEVVRRLGIPPARIRAVPLAAGPAYRPVEDPERVAEVRGRYGLPEHYFLYLGGFDERKNLTTLFRAVAEARRREPGLPPLVVAGALPARETPLIPDPRRLAREAGLDGGVTFPGRIAEEAKPALYSGALAFLFPSRYEGFGLPVLEAMACGAPVIAACATSLREVVGEAGLLVSPDDVAGWADAIVQLARNEELRRGLRALGLNRAAQFSWERTARETAAAYRAVAQGCVGSVE
jgi:glycosyltransferase involved in cell wall biosynthesis